MVDHKLAGTMAVIGNIFGPTVLPPVPPRPEPLQIDGLPPREGGADNVAADGNVSLGRTRHIPSEKESTLV